MEKASAWAGWSIVWGEKFSEVRIIVNPDMDIDIVDILAGRPNILKVVEYVRDTYGLELTTETLYTDGIEGDFEVFADSREVEAILTNEALLFLS